MGRHLAANEILAFYLVPGKVHHICPLSYYLLFLLFDFINPTKNSEAVCITTPPVRHGLFIKGRKSLISPVSR